MSLITSRLQECLRDGDTLARLGGDEFAVLLEDTDTDTARAVAERIVSVVPYEATLADRPVFMSISVGVTTAIPSTTTG